MPNRIEAMIEVIDLYKSFPMAGKELVILRGVSISIQRGEMMAIDGATGVAFCFLLYMKGAHDRQTTGKIK